MSDDDIQAAKRASEAAAARQSSSGSELDPSQGTYQAATAVPVPPPAPVDPVTPTIPAAPTRSSLSDEEIMAQFRDGAIPSTEGMMAALESQLSLREEEDARFAAWEEAVRGVVSDDEAYTIIAPAREAFGGLEPLAKPDVVVEPEPAADPESLTETVANPLLAAIATDTDEVEQAVNGAGETVVSDFDAVVSDADAASPPTSQWPLIVDQAEEDATTPPTEVPTGDVSGVDDGEQSGALAEEPSLVGSGVAVGTDTVTIRDVVATKEIPTEPFQVTPIEKERWFSFDRVGIEPTAEVNRTSGALQLFWTWWAASVPLAGIILGAWLMAEGNDVLQAIVVTLVGVAVGSLPLIVGTVVGIRWGLPTLIASRAAFGLAGNIAPSTLMLLVRLLVSAFFIWAAVWVASGMYVQANLWRFDQVALEVILATIAVVIVGALVMAGRRFVSLMLWVSGGLSLIAAVILIALTWDVPTRATLVAGSWNLPVLVSSAGVVAALLMILWAQSGADVARFGTPGKAVSGTSMVTLAALVPPMVFVGWGVVLGASGPQWRDGVVDNPFQAILGLAPDWYPIPALVLLALPLLGLAALALHSSSYALMSLGFAVTRYVAAASVTVISAALVFIVLMVLGDPTPYFVDAIRVVGVVVAAWTGVFVADVVTRRRPLTAGVLLGSSGSYPALRLAPLAGFAGAIALGWGFTVSNEPAFVWLGYLVGPLTDLGVIALGDYQVGVVVSLVVAAVVTAIAGIRGGILTGSDKSES